MQLVPLYDLGLSTRFLLQRIDHVDPGGLCQSVEFAFRLGRLFLPPFRQSSAEASVGTKFSPYI